VHTKSQATFSQLRLDFTHTTQLQKPKVGLCFSPAVDSGERQEEKQPTEHGSGPLPHLLEEPIPSQVEQVQETINFLFLNPNKCMQLLEGKKLFFLTVCKSLNYLSPEMSAASCNILGAVRKTLDSSRKIKLTHFLTQTAIHHV